MGTPLFPAWLLGISSALLVLNGCASPGKNTAIGAGAGAAVGTAIGGVTGGWKGAAIGAATGAASGAALGNYLDKQAQELEQVAETKRTRDGILVKLQSDLLFDTGSAILTKQAITDVSQLGDILAKYDRDRIKIEGFTDSIGKLSDNEALSLRRAEAVKSVLVSRGVKDNQILVLGLGETNPIASNKTASGRATNRRVQLVINVPQSS